MLAWLVWISLGHHLPALALPELSGAESPRLGAFPRMQIPNPLEWNTCLRQVGE